jgi:hypothetical protein
MTQRHYHCDQVGIAPFYVLSSQALDRLKFSKLLGGRAERN